MALAILRFQDTDENHVRFQVDLGKENRFFTYVIGDGEVRKQSGLPFMKSPIFTSPLIQLAETSLGRMALTVPNDRFDRHNRYIQIKSYRAKDGYGLAISEIVKVPILSSSSLKNAPNFQRKEQSSNPHVLNSTPISLSLETAMQSPPVYTVPFAYREEQPVSSAMFLTALKQVVSKVLPKVTQVAKQIAPQIADALPTVLPIVGNLVGAAVGGGAPALMPGTMPASGDGMMQPNPDGTMPVGATTSSGVAGAIQAITTPEMSQQIASAIRQLTSNPSNAAVNANSPAIAPTQGTSTRTAQAAALSTDDDVLTATAYALGVSPQYVHEMAIPAALMTMLPQLLPLLQQVLTPEMMKTVMDNMPANKLMGAVTEGAKQVAGMIQESEKRTMDHLEKMMPKFTSGSEINNLFQSLSMGMASSYHLSHNYHRVEGVRLKFTGTVPLMLNRRSRVLYHHDLDIAFPLELETPRPIRGCTLQLMVKHSESLKVLIEQKYSIDQAFSGPLKVTPKLSREQLRVLSSNEEYLVCVYLVWSGRSKQSGETVQLGTSMTQLITLISDYCFDRIEGTGNVIPLNNVEKFRPYWHNIWKGNFFHTLQQVAFNCKYYYTLEYDRPNHARMETLTKIEEEVDQKQRGKLKSGLILSSAELNNLLEQIGGYPRLKEEQLKALHSTEFKALFSHAAQAKVQFKGPSSESVALWVYPEFKIQPIILKKVERVNESGHILELSEQPVRFPIPAITHFIGAST